MSDDGVWEYLISRPKQRHDGHAERLPDARQSSWPSDSPRSETRELRGAHISRTDFTGSRLRHARFVGCTFQDCRFDESDFYDARFWNSNFIRCSFNGASFRETGMGGGSDSNKWIESSFAHADLRKSRHWNELYERVDFAEAILDGVDFDGAVMIGCHFSGNVSEVEFRQLPRGGSRWRSKRNAMDGVDFRHAILRATSFHGIDLSRCILPEAGRHIIFPERWRFAHEVLRRLDSDGPDLIDLKVTMQRQIDESETLQSGPGLEHFDELGEGDDERNAAADLLLSLGAKLVI